MSMSDQTITEEDRRSALDVFGEQAFKEIPVAQLPATMMPGGERAFGAMRVAVRRDLVHVRRNLNALAAAAGADWFYRFPVSEKTGTKKFIEGPSIKLANEVAREYGNCDVDCRVFDLGSAWLIYARFHDLETGFSLTRPFQARKSAATLKTKDPGRSDDIALQIGVSKAIRNVVVNALQGLSDYAFDLAREQMVEKIGKNLDRYREKIVARLGELEIPLNAVELSVGRPVDKWLAPDCAKVIAELQAITDGMASATDIYPPVQVAVPDGALTKPGTAKAKGGKSRKAKEAAPEQAPAAEAGAPAPEAQAKPKAASGRVKEPESPLKLRTAMYGCATVDAVEKLWRERVEPFREQFDDATFSQLMATRSDRIDALKSRG